MAQERPGLSPERAGTASVPAERVAAAFVAALATARIVWSFLPDWLDDTRFESDFAQHVWWTWRFADAELFPGDFIADFFSLPVFAPIGFQAWMRLGVQVSSPQTAAETIPFVLAPLLVWLGWRAGRAAAAGAWLGGLVGGCVAVQLVGGFDGLPRDFGFPLLALAVVGLLEGRLWCVGLAGLLAALFYPPIAVNLGATTAVVLGLRFARERALPSGWTSLALLGALAVAIVLGVYASPLPEGVGPKITGHEARALAEFGPEGRSRFFEESTAETFFGQGRGGYGMALDVSIPVAFTVAISALALPGAVPGVAWALLGTGLAAHALAHAVLFALHLPSRYVTYALPLFLLLWLSALAPRLAAQLGRALPGLARPRAWGVAAAGLALAFVALAIRGTRAEMAEPPYVDRVATLEFLATLPKDALVAAHPEDANAIPLAARRSVLASKEVALPYYRGYYARVAERLEAELRAHYALRWRDVDVLHERYGADVMVVHDHRYQPDARDFVEPFESRLGEQLSKPRHRYVLVFPPDDRVLFRRGPWWVVRLGPPRPGYPAREAASPPSPAIPKAAGTR